MRGRMSHTTNYPINKQPAPKIIEQDGTKQSAPKPVGQNRTPGAYRKTEHCGGYNPKENGIGENVLCKFDDGNGTERSILYNRVGEEDWYHVDLHNGDGTFSNAYVMVSSDKKTRIADFRSGRDMDVTCGNFGQQPCAKDLIEQLTPVMIDAAHQLDKEWAQ